MRRAAIWYMLRRCGSTTSSVTSLRRTRTRHRVTVMFFRGCHRFSVEKRIFWARSSDLRVAALTGFGRTGWHLPAIFLGFQGMQHAGPLGTLGAGLRTCAVSRQPSTATGSRRSTRIQIGSRGIYLRSTARCFLRERDGFHDCCAAGTDVLCGTMRPAPDVCSGGGVSHARVDRMFDRNACSKAWGATLPGEKGSRTLPQKLTRRNTVGQAHRDCRVSAPCFEAGRGRRFCRNKAMRFSKRLSLPPLKKPTSRTGWLQTQ